MYNYTNLVRKVGSKLCVCTEINFVCGVNLGKHEQASRVVLYMPPVSIYMYMYIIHVYPYVMPLSIYIICNVEMCLHVHSALIMYMHSCVCSDPCVHHVLISFLCSVILLCYVSCVLVVLHLKGNHS